MRDRKNVVYFKKAGSGSGIQFLNSDLQDPDPAKNGPDPQPWWRQPFVNPRGLCLASVSPVRQGLNPSVFSHYTRSLTRQIPFVT